MSQQPATPGVNSGIASGIDVEQVRVALYHALAADGRAPSFQQLATTLATSEPAVRAAIHELGAQRHVVLDADGNVVMAHPFSTVPLGFSVMGASTLWWGGCAWDSFALPHLLTAEPSVLVATRCPACERPHAFNVTRLAPPPGRQVAHFLVPVAHMWDDVVRTCGNQRIFCDETCVDGWLTDTGHDRGYVMDLGTLWRLAAGWYAGRLDHGYTRRDPATAADYLREVGVSGPFWGLA